MAKTVEAPDSLGEMDWWREEKLARSRGYSRIAGIDEAGRGPLAGPVVAACVVLNHDFSLHPQLNDSKLLSPLTREHLYRWIEEQAIAIGVGRAEPEEIDQLNILRATHLAMRRAWLQITPAPDFVLIDGLPVSSFPCPQCSIIKGDRCSASIAAASIIAKVTRDHLMEEYDRLYPNYDFNRNKGYPTAEHLRRLRQHGPSAIHRRSFNPIAQLSIAFDKT